MIHGRIILTLAILGGWAASVARGQELNRADVAQALIEAENARRSMRIEFEPMCPGGVRPAEASRTVVLRLTDGQGRFRQETRRPPSDERPNPVVQVDTWDGHRSSQQYYFAGKQKTARNNVIVSDQLLRIDDIDELGPSLGLRCWHTEKSLGTLLADPATVAEMRSATLQGRPVVEVKVVGPEFAPNAILVYRYDAERQWLLLEWETYGHSVEDGKRLEEGKLHFHSKVTASDFHEVGSVWMAGRFDNYTTFRPGAQDVEKHHRTTYVRSFELNPEWSDADFTVDLASLPPRSQIADARWGGTYRLGEDVVLLGGRLNKVRQPINEPIDPAHYTDVILGATPIVDPALIAAGLGDRSLSDWLRLAGYLMVAAGAVGAAVLFFRHRFTGG